MNIKDVQNYTVVNQPQAEKAPADNKVLDFLGGTSLAKRLTGVATQVTPEFRTLRSTIDSMNKTYEQVRQQIAKKKAIGGDTTRLEQTEKDLYRDINASTQQLQALATGGVSGRKAFGSTVAFGANLVPGISTVPKAVKGGIQAGKASFTGAAKQAAQSFVRNPLVQEGAGLGATSMTGSYIEEAQNPSAMGAIGSAVGGAAFGGVAARTVQGVSNVIGETVGTRVARTLNPQVRRLAADAVYDFTAAIQPGGSKTAGALTKQYFGGESSKTFKGLQGLYENVPEGFEFTNLAGQQKRFTPDDIDLIDLPSVMVEAKSNIYNKALARLEEVSGEAANVDLTPVKNWLETKKTLTRNKNTQKTIQDRIDEIEGLGDPALIQKYISDEINPKTGAFVTSGSNAVEGGIFAGLQNKLTETLDDYLAANNAPVRELFAQYEGIKSFEKDITRRVAAELRKQGNQQAAEFVDDYGLAVLLSGVSYGNVMQATKGIALVALNALSRIRKDSNVRVRNAIKNVQKYYQTKGVDTVVPPSNVEGARLQRRVNEEIKRSNTPQLPAPSGAPLGVAAGVRNADAIPLPQRTATSIENAEVARATTAFNEQESLAKMAQEFAGEINDVPKEVVVERIGQLRVRAVELETQAEILAETIKDSPFFRNKNNRFLVDREGRLRSVADQAGRGKKLTQKLEDMEAEMFSGRDVEIGEEYTKYKDMQRRLVDLEAEAKRAKIELDSILEDPNIDENTKRGFAKVGTLVGATLATLAGVSQIPTTVTAINPTEFDETVIGDMTMEELKRQIAHRETGVIEEPYSYSRKNKNGTRDLGKYQANSDSLKTWGPKVFGAKVSEKEFLESPEKQEKFFSYIMKRFATEYNIDNPDLAMALWHKGWGNLSQERLNSLLEDEGAKQYLANKPE